MPLNSQIINPGVKRPGDFKAVPGFPEKQHAASFLHSKKKILDVNLEVGVKKNACRLIGKICRNNREKHNKKSNQNKQNSHTTAVFFELWAQGIFWK